MGFYIRKSINVGPIRFNLSKSGIGTSVGIKGLRLGSGPRGNYVHMGREGLYFRRSLGQSSLSPSRDYRPEDVIIDPDLSVEPMQEIESSGVDEMVDSSSKELLEEINRKQKKLRLFPFALIAGALAFFFILGAPLQDWFKVILYIVLLVGVGFSYYWDLVSKSVVILYDMEEPAKSLYEKLHASFNELRECKGTWHIEASGKIRDKKYHAGADEAVRRKKAKFSIGTIPFIRTNIEIPMIPVGRQLLACMPDRLLVIEGRKVGAVSYNGLNLEVASQRFIEEEGVPRDAQVVGQTWRYVNKKGGPDRRFKNNPQLPIALYEQIHLTSQSGLNELISVSRTGFGEKFEDSISELSKYLSGVQTV
jgi:hypothetical protein